MPRPPDPRLLGFLSAYDRNVSEIALALRAMVLEEAPEAIESIYDAYSAVAIGFSFTGRLKDGFCHIATYTNHVNLGLNRGAPLPDPEKVLAGAGKSVAPYQDRKRTRSAASFSAYLYSRGHRAGWRSEDRCSRRSQERGQRELP